MKPLIQHAVRKIKRLYNEKRSLANRATQFTVARGALQLQTRKVKC